MENKGYENLKEELINSLKDEKLKYDEDIIDKALEYANYIYKDSKRYRGESTLSHAIHVACIVAKLKIGVEAVYAAILHEVTKHIGYNFEDLKEIVGEEVANLVKDAGAEILVAGSYIINAENYFEAIKSLK